MTPKEKAKELVERFTPDTMIYTWDGNGYKVDEETSMCNAKNCALICIEEIQDANPMSDELYDNESTLIYWEEVKQEITKL